MLIQFLHIGSFSFAQFLSISSTLYTVNSDFPHSTLHSKGAQGSVRCGPPEIAPPAFPGSEDTPDVVLPLYADLDTLKVYAYIHSVVHYCLLSLLSYLSIMYTEGGTYGVCGTHISCSRRPSINTGHTGIQNFIHHTFSDVNVCVLYH